MTYKTENHIKMELGLNAWRNLLQDKVIQFAHMMPEMDANVMMKLVQDLPQLGDFARLTLQKLDTSTTAAIRGLGLAAAHQQNDHTWHQSSQAMRKLISLDYSDAENKESNKEKSLFLEDLKLQLKECQDLLTFDEQFVRDQMKRNQDSLRTFVIFMLVYTGGCFYPFE